jgi:hypothetical protein
MGLILLLGTPADAGTRDDVYALFTRCNQIPDDRQWLNCIYGAAQPMRGQLGLPPAPDFQVHLVPTGPSQQSTTQSNSPSSAPSASHRTGFFSYLLGGNSVTGNTTLKSYSFDRNSHFEVILSNGEIWRQAADDHVLASWRDSPAHYIVSIRTAALGSYTLAVEGEDQLYRVEREH